MDSISAAGPWPDLAWQGTVGHPAVTLSLFMGMVMPTLHSEASFPSLAVLGHPAGGKGHHTLPQCAPKSYLIGCPLLHQVRSQVIPYWLSSPPSSALPSHTLLAVLSSIKCAPKSYLIGCPLLHQVRSQVIPYWLSSPPSTVCGGPLLCAHQ